MRKYKSIALEGSFSVVSKPIFAPEYSLCSISWDLQDLHIFAAIQTRSKQRIAMDQMHKTIEAGATDAQLETFGEFLLLEANHQSLARLVWLPISVKYFLWVYLF